MIPDVALCDLEAAKWIFFNPAVETITYWANFSAFFFSLGLASFILYQNRKGLANRILFTTLMAFCIWAVCSGINDASNVSAVSMFTWTMNILVEPTIYIGSLYLLYVLIDKKDTLSFNKKLSLGLLYLPVIAFAPTAFMLSDFDITTCLATEGFIGTYYTYSLEILVVFWIIIFAVKRYREATDPQIKKEIISLTAGVLLFLISFASGNIIGSITDNWVIGELGLFGMPIFTASLIYSIVRFKTFNIKFLLSVALVLVLIAFLFLGLFI
jgi:hypothetical protein